MFFFNFYFLQNTNGCDNHASPVLLGWQTNCKLNMGLINKVDMVCLSPVGYGV